MAILSKCIITLPRKCEMKEYYFKKEIIVGLLEGALNKKLGELDSKKVFKKTERHKKITGIAGDIVEQSLLGLAPDNKQKPDLIIDGIEVELKTTGIKISKRDNRYEAKEPMTVTAVSPNKIVNEVFNDSNFWHKLENLLIIYYHYNSSLTVEAAAYADFYIRGYEFHRFNNDDIERLKNDWHLVRDFIISLNSNYEDAEAQYPRLSSELRKNLIYIDTAPKWPHNPRFRLKRNVVTDIVRNHFGNKLEQIPGKYISYNDIDIKLNLLTKRYKGMKVKDLLAHFGIKDKVNKSTAEQIVVRMFEGKSKKISKIELFNKIGFLGKTIVITKNGTRTEDMKLMAVDFEEWINEEEFESSTVYEYFSNNQILCIVFEEPSDSKLFEDNIFLGFKRVAFSDEFITNNVEKVWTQVRYLINHKLLFETVVTDKDNNPIINRNGIIKTSINLPKAKDNIIFFRGTGSDSTDKTLNINGVKMYRQNIWIKGNYITNELKKIDYI